MTDDHRAEVGPWFGGSVVRVDLPGADATVTGRVRGSTGYGRTRVLADVDVGYGGGFDSLWSNWVKANENAGRPENALAVLPGVEQRGDDYVYQP
jgi:hypothetical protein